MSCTAHFERTRSRRRRQILGNWIRPLIEFRGVVALRTDFACERATICGQRRALRNQDRADARRRAHFGGGRPSRRGRTGWSRRQIATKTDGSRFLNRFRQARGRPPRPPPCATWVREPCKSGSSGAGISAPAWSKNLNPGTPGSQITTSDRQRDWTLSIASMSPSDCVAKFSVSGSVVGSPAVRGVTAAALSFAAWLSLELVPRCTQTPNSRRRGKPDLVVM
jgi:hypothetical protein